MRVCVVSTESQLNIMNAVCLCVYAHVWYCVCVPVFGVWCGVCACLWCVPVFGMVWCVCACVWCGVHLSLM